MSTHNPKHNSPEEPVSRKKTLTLLTVAVALVIVAAVALAVGRGSDHKATTAKSRLGVDGVAANRASTPAPVTSSPVAPSPSSTPTSSATSSRPSNMKPAAKTSSVTTAPHSAAARKAITYTVKPGDNLTVIAAWFKLHGYGDLYQRNMKVIGSNPDLIFPGQTITISPAGASLGSAK